MLYRVFYILSNEEIDLNNFEHNKFKAAKNDSNEEIKLFFNEDMKNVLSNSTYLKVSQYKYMYGFAIEHNKSMLHDIKKLFNLIDNLFNTIEIVFDTGSKRYINEFEFKYYCNNIMPLDKLFNVDISSSQYKTEYKTVGLQTIGLDEIKMYSSDYYNNTTYKKFKHYICNSIALGNFPLLMIREECHVIDEDELNKLDYPTSNDLNTIYNKHLVDNYSNFVKLFETLKNNKYFSFYLNGIKLNINDNIPPIENITYLNFKQYFTNYKIETNDITYDCLNIFYALKYL